MKVKRSIRMKNMLYPGYSACSKCGGNWGWKKSITHMVSKHSGLFLFCEECDKIVTIEERWKALDEWKVFVIIGMIPRDGRTIKKLKAEIEEILDTEFIEYPRKKT